MVDCHIFLFLIVDWKYRVFIKYCAFFEDFKIFRTLAFLCFPSASVCTHTRQVEHQRIGRVQKNHKNTVKETIFYEHPVAAAKWQLGGRLNFLWCSLISRDLLEVAIILGNFNLHA